MQERLAAELEKLIKQQTPPEQPATPTTDDQTVVSNAIAAETVDGHAHTKKKV